VAERRAKAQKRMKQLQKKGMDIRPVEIEGRKIAHTFWGKAWCDHIESFSDYANRLPRGRTYVRNGSVCHLDIEPGEISAMVSGTQIYTVTIGVDPLPSDQWEAVRKRCAGRIGSILELLEGRFSENVMDVVTDRKTGLFPLPGQIHLGCSCPDWATMCKHVAAVLYGVGARLDEAPELLFRLRNVDHEELIQADMELGVGEAAPGDRRRIAEDDLGDVFGIEMDGDGDEAPEPVRPRKKAAAKKSSAAAGGSKKSASKKAAPKTKRAAKADSKTGAEKSAGSAGAKSKAAKSGKSADSKAAAGKSAKPGASGSRSRKSDPAVAAKTTSGKSSNAAETKAKSPKSDTSAGKSASKSNTAKSPSAAGKTAKRTGGQNSGTPKPASAVQNPQPVTGSEIARLRDDFDMTQAEFAELMGVSPATVSNWENRSGRLNLQTRTREAWEMFSRMTIDEAWALLEGE
jgi:uncharacterized Zn finger protein/DNA-binding transcriptional regulator YiaG